MIRLILVVLFLIIYFILSIPAFGILWIVGKINQRAKDIASLRIVQGAFKIIRFLSGARTKVIGLENIPKDEPVLFVGNHRGMFDIVIAYSEVPNLTGFIAKKEIEKVPLLRVWMRMLYCLFLDRSNPREGLKTILAGIAQIKDGISMGIFPEGTRNKSEGDELLEFKEGSMKLAEKSGCKIIPMVQNNTECVIDKQFPLIKSTKTVLEFMEPIDVTTLSREEKKVLGATVRQIIQDRYIENKKYL